MDAVKIIKDADWRLEVGDITREQYKELVAPLRDVEAVVRCRDCKKAEHDKIFREYWCRGREIDPDGYCSDGERKDGDNGSTD